MKRKFWVYYDTPSEHGFKGFEMIEQAEIFISDVIRRNGTTINEENFLVIYGDSMILEPKEIIKTVTLKLVPKSV